MLGSSDRYLGRIRLISDLWRDRLRKTSRFEINLKYTFQMFLIIFIPCGSYYQIDTDVMGEFFDFILVDYMSSIFTLLGVILGSGITYFASSKIKKDEINRMELRDEIKIRRDIYSRFMGEVNQLALLALDKKSSDFVIFSKLASYMSEIELVASKPVIKSGECMMRHVINLHQTDWEESGFNTTLSILRDNFITEIKKEQPELKN